MSNIEGKNDEYKDEDSNQFNFDRKFNFNSYGEYFKKSNSIAKAMDNYNKLSTVKAGDIIDSKKVKKVEKNKY